MKSGIMLLVPLLLGANRPGATTEAVNQYLTAQMEKYHIPGMSVAVVREGNIVLSRNFGLANVELGVPTSSETVYSIGSVTKHFTAAAVLLLVEEGKLNLDDNVARYLTDIPNVPPKVTIRHLLTHTSGIIDHTEIPGSITFARQDRLPREVVKDALAHKLLFAPGDQFSYSNTNYFLLGMIIERTNRRAFGSFANERIFRPLQLTATRMNQRRDIIKNRASGYNWAGKTLRNADYSSPTNQWTSGGMLSSVADLARWEAALLSNKLLRAATLQQMVTPAHLRSGQRVKYGLGNELANHQGHRVAGHGGETFGFSSAFLRYIDDKLAVIVLCNLGDAPCEVFAERMAALYLDLAIVSYDQSPGIEDKDSKITEMLRGVLTKAAQGKADEGLFTADAQRELLSTIRRAGQELPGTKGALKTLTLHERRESEGRRLFVCRAAFAKGTLIWKLEATRDDKIAALEPSPD